MFAAQFNIYNDAESSRMSSQSIFVKGFADKTTVHVNEPLVFTFQFFTASMLLSTPSYQAPDFNGFFTDISEQTSFTTVISGREYMVTQIKTLLFPQKAGTLSINKGVLKIEGDDYRNRILGIMGFALPSRNLTLETDLVTINVLPLPQDAALNGKFTVKARTDANSYITDEPFNLIITISGNGNARTVPTPDIKVSDNLKTYETSSKTTNGKTIAAYNSEREFTTLIMPRAPGPASISMEPIKYFDYETGSLRVLKPEDIIFTVTGETKLAPTAAAPQNERDGYINNGENNIAPDYSINFLLNFLSLIKKYLLWICLCVLAFILYKIFAAYIKRLRKNAVKNTGKKAYVRSKKYFQKAKNTSDAKEFYSAMYKGALEYLASIYNQSAEGLTTYQIKNMLAEAGRPNEIIDEIENILNECQAMVYSNAGATFNERSKEFYDKTLKVLKEI